MRRKKKARVPAERFVPVGILVLICAFSFLSPGSPLNTQSALAAGSGNNYAYSENIGWISFHSANQDDTDDPNVCLNDATHYSVCVSDSGNLSGYAWTDSIGWISFNAADVAGCPSGSCAPQVTLADGNVSGWARACGSFDDKNACSGTQNQSGGWEGWIHLEGVAQNGEAYGPIQAADCSWSGWSWGGGTTDENSVTGAIHYDGPTYQASVAGACNVADSAAQVMLTAAPAPGYSDSVNSSYVAYASATSNVTNNVTLTLSTSNVASCTAITGGYPNQSISTAGSYNQSGVTLPGTSRNPNAANANGSIAAYPTLYSITCTPADGSANITAEAPISVAGVAAAGDTSCVISNFSANPSKVKKGSTSDLTWAAGSNCNVCSISGSDGSSYANLPISGTQKTNGLQQSTTFTLVCTGTGSDSRSVTVGIEPIIIEI